MVLTGKRMTSKQFSFIFVMLILWADIKDMKAKFVWGGVFLVNRDF